MKAINFELRIVRSGAPKRSPDTPISGSYATVNLQGGQSVNFSVGLKIVVRKWDQSSQRLKAVSNPDLPTMVKATELNLSL